MGPVVAFCCPWTTPKPTHQGPASGEGFRSRPWAAASQKPPKNGVHRQNQPRPAHAATTPFTPAGAKSGTSRAATKCRKTHRPRCRGPACPEPHLSQSYWCQVPYYRCARNNRRTRPYECWRQLLHPPTHYESLEKAVCSLAQPDGRTQLKEQMQRQVQAQSKGDGVSNETRTTMAMAPD